MTAAEAQMKMTEMHGGTDVSGLHRQGAFGTHAVADGNSSGGMKRALSMT